MRSKHFKLAELVPLSVINSFHEDLLWNMFDEDILKSIDTIKEKFSKGSISINTYMWNGDRTQSGIRTKNSKYYSEGSMHSVGKAVDMIFSKYTTDEVREYILANQDEFPFIRRIEADVSWLHIDTKDTGKKEIITFKV